MLDTKALAQATATIFKTLLDERMTPLLARIDALEQRAAIEPQDGKDGRDGVDGKDADIGEIRAMLAELVAGTVPDAVKAAVDALPPPERGEKGDKGDRGEDGAAGERGQDGIDGKDGVGLSDAMIDRSGELVLTMTDGRMKNLGVIVGKDGEQGRPGVDGRDGRDGQDVDDITVTQDGALVTLSFQVGDTRTIFDLELPAGPAGENGRDAYAGEARGLYDPDGHYRKMDVVSFNGSEWRAKQDEPGELPGPGWMLSASKGKRGERGERGLDGQAGNTPVAQYLRGTELVTTLSDGLELTADLSEIMQRD